MLAAYWRSPHPDKPGDAIFIFTVLTANAFFGFWQENQAEQAMDALKHGRIQLYSSQRWN